MFGFFGITDVRFVRAEGVAMGEKRPRRRRSAAAEADIQAHAGEAANEDATALAGISLHHTVAIASA